MFEPTNPPDELDRVAELHNLCLLDTPPKERFDRLTRIAKRLCPGISDEFRDRIFEKFSQADASDSRQKGGTGLGLNISQALVHKMGGQIGFVGRAGAGSTFFFEFPQWRNPDLAVQLPPAAVQPVPARPRILICESDPGVARLIRMMLESPIPNCSMRFSAPS